MKYILTTNSPITRKKFIVYFTFSLVLNLFITFLSPIISLGIPGNMNSGSLLFVLWIFLAVIYLSSYFGTIYLMYKSIFLRLKDLDKSIKVFNIFTIMMILSLILMENGYLSDDFAWLLAVWLVYISYIFFICVFMKKENIK